MTRKDLALLTISMIVALAGVQRNVHADCANSGITVWPSTSDTLPANGMIAIEGYGIDQDLIRTLSSHNPRLVSNQDTVPLRVASIQEGQMALTQAILEPQRELTVGRRYQLLIDGRQSPHLWVDYGRTQAAWTIGAADRTAPSWSSAPIVRPSTYESFGCGPAVFGHVDVAIQDAGTVRVRVRLRQEGTSTERVYDVNLSQGDLRIGHNMCSGAFRLAAGVRYTVRLEAIDTGGNVTPAPGSPITIIGPRPRY